MAGGAGRAAGMREKRDYPAIGQADQPLKWVRRRSDASQSRKSVIPAFAE
jgi:hypothetical protein